MYLQTQAEADGVYSGGQDFDLPPSTPPRQFGPAPAHLAPASKLAEDPDKSPDAMVQPNVLPTKPKPAVVPNKSEPAVVPDKQEPAVVPNKTNPPAVVPNKTNPPAVVPNKTNPAVVPNKTKTAVVKTKSNKLNVDEFGKT